MSQGSPPSPPQDLSASGLTIPSDSEAYSSLSPPSSSPPRSSSNNHGEGSPVVLYQPPTVWSILRGAAINLLLPFINGMMLGFGELLAHELAFRLGWGGTNVWPKNRASRAHTVGPGVEMRDDPIERRRRNNSLDRDMRNATSLE